MRYFYLLFFCLFLLRPAPSYQDDTLDETEAEDTRRSLNLVKSPVEGSSGGEGTTIEITFQSDEDEEDTVDGHSGVVGPNVNVDRHGSVVGPNRGRHDLVGTNIARHGLVGPNIDEHDVATKRSGERYGYGGNRRSYGNRRSENLRMQKRNPPSGPKSAPISMLGAAMNALNPMPYFRGSFNGFRNVLRHNIKPFRQMVAGPSDSYPSPYGSRTRYKTHDYKNTETNQGPSTEVPQTEASVTTTTTTISTTTQAPATTVAYKPTNAYPDSVAEPSVHTNHGFSLKIPPELAHHSALEVNLKPNGEIDITPVNKSDTNDRNLVTQNTAEHPVLYPPPFYSHNLKKHGAATNHFNSFQPPNFASSNNAFADYTRPYFSPSQKVKLVTDSPMVVNSIQDIIKLHNLVGMENSQAKLSHINNLLRDNPIPIDLSQFYLGNNNNNKDVTNQGSQSSFGQTSNSFSKSNSPEHIYLLPFKVNNNNEANDKKAPSLQTQPPPLPTPQASSSFSNLPSDSDDDASEIYYIDITIPGSTESKPVVNHQRFKRKNGQIVKKRKRRSAEHNRRIHRDETRRIRYVNYDGWRPLDVVDPMLNEPTLIYKPPSLKRVHFGEDPPEEKPLFPIVPVNPTVYVVRAEASSPTAQRHSIYGTENVDYLHINPQSNSAKVYSSFHNIQSENEQKPKENKEIFREDKKKPAVVSKIAINVKPILELTTTTPKPTEEEYETEVESETENTIETSATNDSATNDIEASNSVAIENNLYNSLEETNEELENKTQLQNEQEEQVMAPVYSLKEILGNFTLSKDETDEELVNATISDDHNNPELNEVTNETNEENSFADKSFSVGEDYYYVYEDSEPEQADGFQSTDFDDLLASSSDPFASILPRRVTFEEELPKDPYVSSDDPEETLQYSGSQTRKETTRRAPLHERLKNFDGVQVDRYVFSASEKDEKELSSPVPPPSGFRFRNNNKKNVRAETGREIGSSPRGKNLHREWYLIETRTVAPTATTPPPPKQKKVKSSSSRRNDFSNRHLSKYSDAPYIYNRYLDDHLNSFKPTDSLTANSLSELLQIFKYVTTPGPIQEKPINEKERLSFRYTKPTNPPRFTTERPGQYTTFRYTITTPNVDAYSHLPYEEEDLGVLDGPLIVLNDSVAETNSLDGYLFSDSVAAPEYKKLESSQPNVIRLDAKEQSIVRFDQITKDNDKMDKDAIRRGELSPTLVIDAPANSEKELDSLNMEGFSYRIQEGHSKVKIFGANENEKQKNEGAKKAKAIAINPYKMYDHLTTLPPGVVIRPIEPVSPPHSSSRNRNTLASSHFKSDRTTGSPLEITSRSLNLRESDGYLPSNSDLQKRPKESRNGDSFVHFPIGSYDYLQVDDARDAGIKSKSSDSFDEINIDAYPDREFLRHNLKLRSHPMLPHPTSVGQIPPTEDRNRTGKTERLVDLSALPSPLETFSRLILSYFSRNKDKEEELNPEPLGSQRETAQEESQPVFFNKRKQEEQKIDDHVGRANQDSALSDYLEYLKQLEKNE